ncbi:hypothetical protein BC792_11849 [Sphingobacterium allocomposti]|uniref:Uncharacterized protein n=1 Tax=Sphingobacterium allocomposti TaxID=415956 RepID=A0A5S5DAN3_9SPHI|nr:hypothetical protein BC792_11849 [Sphingobacterium composti Yoo et al. 2007 non Ten et al. 2007]
MEKLSRFRGTADKVIDCQRCYDGRVDGTEVNILIIRNNDVGFKTFN